MTFTYLDSLLGRKTVGKLNLLCFFPPWTDKPLKLRNLMNSLKWSVNQKRVSVMLLVLPSRGLQWYSQQLKNQPTVKTSKEFFSNSFYTVNPSPVENFVKKPSTFRLDIKLDTDNPSKTNYPSDSTSSRRANRRISLRRLLLHNSC